MKTRLGIFIAALLLLPLAGFLLGGGVWGDLAAGATADDGSIAAALRTSMTLLFYVLLINHTVKRLTGQGPLDTQRKYFIGVSIASALFCWQLSYMNLFAASWSVQQDNSTVVQFLLYTPLFALLAPAVLVTRSLLAGLPGMLKAMNFRFSFTPGSDETLARILLAAAIFGLAAGASWPDKLAWLLWASPLLLLLAMQLLWHEGTIFSGLKSGDAGRVVCTALSGIAVCNLAVISYQANASLTINLHNTLLTQAGFALFGLTCLQLGDVIAENWRGKSSPPIFRRKFPIPVVVKKN
ncbi:MAG: hypothetical protein PHP85_05400 [Gallionella sp.]|nr:hypothetical protein [Gallionella sp.]